MLELTDYFAAAKKMRTSSLVLLPSDSHLLHRQPVKNDKKCFSFSITSSSFLRSLHFSLGYVEERLRKKAMVNFEVYDVTDWTTNNCNAHLAQYLMK